MFSLRIADNHDGTSVWSSRSELPLAPTPAHIEDCVADIAADIISSIERKELERRENRGMNAGNAYDLYLQSKRLFFGAIEDAYVDRVVDLLEQAIAASPMFAPAYDHLIQIYNTGMFFSRVGMDMTQPRKRAMQLAQNLLSINAKNPHAHIAMAWCQIWRKNFMAAERAIDTAIGLRPYEAHRLNSVATALVYLGRLDEAEEYYGQALRRMGNDMDYQRTDIGELHYLKRDFDQALSWLESGESRARYRTLFWRIPTYAQLGRLDEAGRDIEELDEEFRRRWHGNGDYNRKDGIRWYLDFKVMKRNIDRDILLDGLAKAGLLS